jgi:hypothetical protein
LETVPSKERPRKQKAPLPLTENLLLEEFRVNVLGSP